MPWKALKRLLEMQGISLGFEDSKNLHRLIKVKGDNEMVSYKDALTHVQPNIALDDPIRSVWTLRKSNGNGDNLSRMFASRQSGAMSQVSQSPSKISMHSLNNPVKLDV